MPGPDCPQQQLFIWERLQTGKELVLAVLWNVLHRLLAVCCMGFWQIHHCPLWCVGLWWWCFFLGQFGLWCLHVCPVVQKGQWCFLSDLLLGLSGKVSGVSHLQQVG